MEIKISSPKRSQFSTRYCTAVSTLDSSFVLTNQQLKQKIPKDEIVQFKQIKNSLLQDKLQVLLKVDENLIDKIKKKMQMKKQNSKMSILSMQRQKFVVSRGPSTFRRVFNSIRKQQDRLIKQNSFTSILKSSGNLQQVSIRRQGKSYANQKVERFKKYLKILSLKHPKKNKGRKSQILAKSLIDYFNDACQDNVLKQLFQIQALSDELIKCLTKSDHKFNLSIFRSTQHDVSKLILNICYEVYCRKKRKISIQQLVTINKQIQYCSRRLGMFDLTLRTCFDLGRLNCDRMNYTQAISQYQKAVKLAIHLNNKYYEEVAVDKMGLCKYYMQDSTGALFYHNNSSYLSNYDRIKIKEEYSNQQQINRLVQQKKKIKVKKAEQKRFFDQKTEFQINIGQLKFQHQPKKENYSVTNNLQFKMNFKNIIKIDDLKSKIHLIKKCVKKVDRIGQRRYCGDHYVVPKASRYITNEGGIDVNQVCLSHRSFNRSNIQQETIKIQNQCKLLIKTLNYFINQGIIQVSEDQFNSQF